MKKLRLFDSLKLVVAVVAATFILNVAHADTSINSVIAYGKTEQSGTPTPTNPVPIMTNNGVLKYGQYGKNLFDVVSAPEEFITNITYTSSIGQLNITVNGNYARLKLELPQLVVGEEYTFSFNSNITDIGNVRIVSDSGASYSDVVVNKKIVNGQNSMSFTATHKTLYVFWYPRTNNFTEQFSFILSNIQLEKGSIATSYEPYHLGIYADGMVETIRDSAGHTATAQMLLSVGDYKDEQNINTGAITRKVGVKVLDGTESWDIQSNYTDVFYLRTGLESSQPNTCICTHFNGIASNVSVNTLTDGDIKYGYGAQPDRVYIRYSAYNNDLAGFKTYLASQYAAGTPVIVVYPLAESAQTTEPAAVAPQTLNTAPVRQTAGSILGMPIEVVLGDGTSEWVSEMITIATTRYNEEQFEPVQNRLSDAMDAVDDVVTRTMSQAQAIDQIATSKQTRPDESCPVGKNCLLVEDERGVPHWYVIAGADEANPSTNP